MVTNAPILAIPRFARMRRNKLAQPSGPRLASSNKSSSCNFLEEVLKWTHLYWARQADTANKAVDLAAVMKIAMVALRLMKKFQSDKGRPCVLARIVTIALIHPKLAAIEIDSVNHPYLAKGCPLAFFGD